jgi:hypothetical protein
MWLRGHSSARRADDKGSTLVIVAGAMIALLAMSALAIDLVTFYAVRTEAQRAADAAALAGAEVFLTSSCTSGGDCTAQQAAARQAAKDGGAQNKVAGQPASILDSDITFTGTATDPQITVAVARDSAHGDAMPTIFGKVLGISNVNISVSATAEAFNPSGSGTPIAATCLKPWILPNCDQDHTSPATNLNCPGIGTFIDPATGAISNPGPAPTGVIGEHLVIKYGDPHSAPAPSQFYPIDLPPAPYAPSICPSCAANGGGGGSLYSQNISCCNGTAFISGGSNAIPVNWETGNLQGPTEHGVECLINQNPQGGGQDVLNTASPLSITGGSNNPNPALVGVHNLTQSSSIITIPLYDGHAPCPGGSCGTSVTIIGFLQAFIDSVDGPGGNQGNVYITVLNVSGSGGSGGGGGTPTVAAGGAFIPVRLIHQ